MDKTDSPHPKEVCVVVGMGVNLHWVSGAYYFLTRFNNNNSSLANVRRQNSLGGKTELFSVQK